MTILSLYSKLITNFQFIHLIESAFGKSTFLFSFCINSEGKQWHRARRLLSKKILPPQKVGAYVGVINEVIEDMVQRLRYVRDVTNKDGMVPELTNEMYKWSMECEYLSPDLWLIDYLIDSFDYH